MDTFKVGFEKSYDSKFQVTLRHITGYSLIEFPFFNQLPCRHVSNRIVRTCVTYYSTLTTQDSKMSQAL